MAKKFYRSRKDRILCGICGGLGNYFRIDPSFIRIVMVFLCIFTGIFLFIFGYLLCCWIVPLEPSTKKAIHIKRLHRSKSDRKIAGICGGIAKFFHIDSTFVRLITVILCFVTAFFPLILVYIIAWILIPEEIERPSLEI